MSKIQKETFAYGEQYTDVNCIANFLRIFLIWALLTSFFSIFLCYSFLDVISEYLNIWFVIYSIIITTSFILSLFSTRKNLSSESQEFLNNLICLCIGAMLSIGILIFNYYVPVIQPDINTNHLITLSTLLLSGTYLFSILYLTQRFLHFIFIFVPSSLAFLLSDVIFPHLIAPQYYICLIVWFSILFIGGLVMHRKQRQYSQFIINNQILQNNAAQYLESSRKLSEQLSISSLRSKEIENELQLNNQLLEQKVKSRTYDIEQMNIRLENHRQNLALAHEAAGIHSWVWNIEKRTIEFLGSELNKLFYQKTYHTHKTKSIIHPDDLNTYNTLMRAHLRGFSDHFECSYRVKVQEQWIWFHDTGRVVSRNSQNKKPLRMVGIRRNIQKEKNDQEQLRLAANVFDQVAEGVFVLDHNLCFVEVNPYFEKLTGLDQKQILGKHLFDITKNNCTDTINYHTTMYQRLIQTDEYDAEATEEFISGKKISIWTHINAVRDEKNKVIHYVGIVTDLTERKKQELRLSYLENYDTLTDLPNRLYFNNQLHQYLSDSLHSLKHLAVIRVNIDRFRFFNEYLSNHAGDELLKQVAGRLRQANPQALLISHLNNDDFAIIYNLNNYSVKQHCQNILQALNKPFYINLQEHFITVSIGVALYPEHGRQIDSLNIHAEQALAEAKQLGGNTIRLYSHKASPLLNSSINLDRDLRQAIKNKELIVYYQPKISLTSKKVYGFEALIRWNHPVRGLIAPDTFLPFAEESSLISEIGYFVLLETCKQIKSWINHGFPDISVSVNIVAQQIHRGRLLTDLKEALELYNIDGHHLELEITESSLIDHSKNVEKLLEQIKKENISISLDDFGTGYSSLAYLTRYPFDTLKIDRAFVNKIGDHKDEAIITAMIAMGKAMGMNIVAEGVETIEQVNFLKHQGCDILQGFYFSKPLNALESTEFLKHHKLIAV